MIRVGTFVVAMVLSVGSVGSVGWSRADEAEPDWIPIQQIIEKALKSGYTQITKVEADDGRWEGEGIKNGQKMEFRADPKTGEIISEKVDH